MYTNVQKSLALKPLKQLKANQDPNTVVNSVYQKLTNQSLKVDFENACINNNMTSLNSVLSHLNNEIRPLKKINPIDNSKKKTKKAKKAISRLPNVSENRKNAHAFKRGLNSAIFASIL